MRERHAPLGSRNSHGRRLCASDYVFRIKSCLHLMRENTAANEGWQLYYKVTSYNAVLGGLRLNNAGIFFLHKFRFNFDSNGFVILL